MVLDPQAGQYAEVTGIVLITGFAIQQAMQILDLPISAVIHRFDNNGDGPFGLPFADFKKIVMTAVAFLIAIGVTIGCDLRTLYFINPERFKVHDTGDLLVTAFVLSAGTEGVNTLIKYFGYVKDLRKAAVIGVE